MPVLNATQAPDAAALLTSLGWLVQPPIGPRKGCHVELCSLPPGAEPDGCVIDEGRPEDCMFARSITCKEQCNWWREVTPESIIAAGGQLE